MTANPFAHILGVALASTALGAALARWGELLPLRPGVAAALLMVIAAVWVRRHWAQRRTIAGDDPSAAERTLWLYLVGTALIVGFVASVLMTPGSEVHRDTGDTGGLDSWLMLLGGGIAWWVLHEPGAPRDERDRDIAAYGDRVGYWALVLLLVAFLLALGFAPREAMQRFTHWLIANTLLNLIMLACLVQYVAQLARYARERGLLHADAAE
jgi:peptidoglycan biosynthesis protein MviN/MurJ (putative lipid II flippase)